MMKRHQAHTPRVHLTHRVVADFAPRHIARPRVLLPGRKSDRGVLANLGVGPFADVAMPNVVIHDLERDCLFLIDASPRHGHMTETRAAALRKHFAACGRHFEIFSAYADLHHFARFADSIAWETHVWIAAEPDHMIHFNGERFLGPYP